MITLAEKNCEACRSGAPLATETEVASYMQELQGWRVADVAGVKHLKKNFTFKNFAQALRFTDQVGALAEQENHHPAILTEWGRVTVSWWTHKIGGLHANDFIMAAKTDRLISRHDNC